MKSEKKTSQKQTDNSCQPDSLVLSLLLLNDSGSQAVLSIVGHAKEELTTLMMTLFQQL